MSVLAVRVLGDGTLGCRMLGGGEDLTEGEPRGRSHEGRCPAARRAAGAGRFRWTRPHLAVTMHSTVDLSTFTGTWSAAGGIADSGTLAEPSAKLVGNGELHIDRVVTGTLGTFTIHINSKFLPQPDGTADFTGQWVIKSGTSAYADLHGTGDRTAHADLNGTVTETLTGTIHYD